MSLRWIIAGLFGLVHGFGFADILKDQLQVPRAETAKIGCSADQVYSQGR